MGRTADHQDDDQHREELLEALQRLWDGADVPIHQPPRQELRHADLLRILQDS